MRKRALLLIIVSLVAALLVFGALASASAGVPPPRRDERSERISQRVQAIINRFNARKDQHLAVYNNVKNKLKEIADTLEAKGYDVSKVRSDYQNLDSMIQKAASDYSAFIATLQGSLQYTPLQSEGQFMSMMETARAQLGTFRQDCVSIKDFYLNTIRPDVKALKDQKPGS